MMKFFLTVFFACLASSSFASATSGDYCRCELKKYRYALDCQRISKKPQNVCLHQAKKIEDACKERVRQTYSRDYRKPQ